MAAKNNGCILTTIVTCEGNLSDPDFSDRFERVLGKLNGILGEVVKVRKLEPWNSVRVTLSIPREAALRLRQLASEGSAQLRALGILSVQVEGDQVISLRLVTNAVNAEPQEIILRTAQDGGSVSGSARQEAEAGLARFLPAGSGQMVNNNKEASEKVQFKSPNVVCPPDNVVPKVPVSGTSTSNATPPTTKNYGGPFPFTSMNQAIHSREGLGSSGNYTGPPPPYPGKQPPPPPPVAPAVAISSPLLVNLLQNDGAPAKTLQKSGGDVAAASATNLNSAVKHVANRTIQNSFVQKVAAAAAQVVVGPSASPLSVSARTMQPNRTVPGSFVQKASFPVAASSNNSNPSVSASASASAVTHRLLSNNLESEVVLNTNSQVSVPNQNSPLNVSSVSLSHANPHHPPPPIGISAPPILSSSATSLSALSNTSIRQNNNKLNSTTNSVTIPNSTTIMGHYNVPNKLQNAHPAPTNPTTQSAMNNNINNNHQIMNNSNNRIATQASTRILPPPPPYSVAVNRTWDSLVQATPILDLTPSLTDLKSDDLDDLLPTLERDLARSPPEIPEELTTSSDKRNFLINPLTGELEPHSCSESDADELNDVFSGLPSPASLSDEDTNSTVRPDTTDQSDSETRSSHSDSGKHSRLKNSKMRDRGRDSPSLKTTEKIKLRLKLEKSEPINSAYKVDISFIQQPKKASTSVVSTGEELRVPPLHISLRGRHHAFITNKKKSKINTEGSSNNSLIKPKVRKVQDYVGKLKRSNEVGVLSNSEVSTIPKLNDNTNLNKSANLEVKKVKKLKTNHEDSDLKSKLMLNSYREKQKERRGSDSDLVRSSMKFADSNGIVSMEKKRRLSQSESTETEQPTVLGSTNVGTITGLPQKSRKDKIKIKDSFKSNKEIIRNKNYNNAKTISDKFTKLPTGEIDVEAIIKQRLLEDSEKGVPRPPHRTAETVHQVMSEIEKSEVVVVKEQSEPPPIKDKSPEPDKCNTPDRKQNDLGDKQSGTQQGEDSGIESMDALSEKSPNQASQSPHADIPESIKSKTQVPDILDIEAQLAKMEGLNGNEDLNENQHDAQTKLSQCCELTSALQDSLKQGAVTLSVNSNSLPIKEQSQQAEVSLVPLKTKMKEDDLEPLPIRVTPPLYTYSNPDKGRGSESPSMSDEDSNPCSNIHKSKSLLEQLLIEIPDNQTPSSPSPATRSVRTRALSKLNSPELNSPVQVKHTRSATPANVKRKRHESDSSNNSLDDVRNKKTRKCSENAAELIKACMGVDATKMNNVKKSAGKVHDESSDSDEPLIEKVRKTNNTNNSVAKNKVKNSAVAVKNSSTINTRRSVRTAIPVPNTRSKGDTEALRRKTRSAVSEGEGKRKKEVK